MSGVWWKEAVIYQIYPRSFADSNGDGVGDLPGILDKLDYLAWLGVDAVWLSPFYRSPMADAGYDVSDYCDVDPLFGTLADFDRLLAAAHARGLKVLLDWVPNHTSIEHPWFADARSGRKSTKRNWYVFRDPKLDGSPPNNWSAAFPAGPAWSLDEGSGQYYLHCFTPEQPDLDWSNPAVERAMHDVLRFWLDRGVDGFRADVVHLIGKDPALADVSPDLAAVPFVVLSDHPSAHIYLRRIRSLLDGYGGDRVMVGEVFLLQPEQFPRYYGRDDELHLVFNFLPMFTPWLAKDFGERIAQTARDLEPLGAWPTWVLNNHDQKRVRTRLQLDDIGARAAAMLTLTLRGTPFLYMGEELGLEDAAVPSTAEIDPGGRDGCRAPLPWDATPAHGWKATPWLPFPPESELRNVRSQQDDPSSIVHFYRRLMAARRASTALRRGKQQLLAAPEQVLAWSRREGDDARLVLINFGAEAIRVEQRGRIVVSSSGRGEGTAFDGVLAGREAVLLR
jgi:alpha-glucosidase